MPDRAVALVLTFAEAGAQFGAASMRMHRKSELEMRLNEKAQDAFIKVAKGMGSNPCVEGSTINLLPRIERSHKARRLNWRS
jgi:hypothetical protein